MEALHDVVKAGKARTTGASAMWAWQFQRARHVAEKHGWTRFVSMQNHLNFIYREEKIGVIPYSPLASGRLTRDWSSDTLRAQTDEIRRPNTARPRKWIGRSWRGSRRSRTSTEFRAFTSHLRGCCRSRPSPRPSSEPRSRT